MRALIVGGTGFVGRALAPALARAGHEVRVGTRAARSGAVVGGTLVRCDLDDEDSVRGALDGVELAYFLVHGLRRADFSSWETATAARFAHAARAAGVRRVVYLGGLEPAGGRSAHLESRLATGRALASTGLEVVELRAPVVIGAGGESWRLARDLAVRAPALLAPPWLAARQQPVALADVVAALVAAPRLPPGAHALIGPEEMSAREILRRTAVLAGHELRFLPVPAFSRRLAGRLAPLLTRAHVDVARALATGLGLDVVATQPGVFAHLPELPRTSFDQAVALALHEDRVAAAPALYEALLRVLLPARRTG
ncbi:MAG: NmrA family NAD(P)-binding protein [Deltaproteobacteria bacterium]|nr:NmrA family NAD(P)-binding protein [Deltaproteobacteria bacterium]